MDNFDDVRPYNDNEISAAMMRIAEDKYFSILSEWLFPNRDIDEVRQQLRTTKTADDFQFNFMSAVNQNVINKSINRLTYSGIEFLQKDQSYLFISNHRDIMLDSSLLQQILHWNNLKTSLIAFGSNLMSSQLIIDIERSNKMFIVKRDGSMRDMYQNSMQLSKFIRKSILDDHESVWIAQRNGRSKDGNDQTDQGIIKMFCMSEPDVEKALTDLHLVPIAVSYSIEPCDILKTRELYISQNEKYEKQNGEDLISIITGIEQQKGNTHFSICKPITKEELDALEKQPESKYHQLVARLIDQRIYEHYKLMPNNFIAHDMLHNNSRFAHYYTLEERLLFEQMAESVVRTISGNTTTVRAIYLGIYANPVDNILKVKEII
ncbi:MAG: 1-acyl-sn-glycerol-3-phosphate acyltransferase [Lentimicrobiaceae bacterium]|jgi:hypothetical protein|nr:1-acyl-sn-glycerol-3-phosphate acyltransferase [Lentimicrobiaceae bacterium]